MDSRLEPHACSQEPWSAHSLLSPVQQLCQSCAAAMPVHCSNCACPVLLQSLTSAHCQAQVVQHAWQMYGYLHMQYIR